MTLLEYFDISFILFMEFIISKLFALIGHGFGFNLKTCQLDQIYHFPICLF